MKIFYTVINNGDGSYGIEYFNDFAAIDLLSEDDPERYPSESDGSLIIDPETFNHEILTMGDAQLIIDGEY